MAGRPAGIRVHFSTTTIGWFLLGLFSELPQVVRLCGFTSFCLRPWRSWVFRLAVAWPKKHFSWIEMVDNLPWLKIAPLSEEITEINQRNESGSTTPQPCLHTPRDVRWIIIGRVDGFPGVCTLSLCHYVCCCCRCKLVMPALIFVYPMHFTYYLLTYFVQYLHDI